MLSLIHIFVVVQAGGLDGIGNPFAVRTDLRVADFLDAEIIVNGKVALRCMRLRLRGQRIQDHKPERRDSERSERLERIHKRDPSR